MKALFRRRLFPRALGYVGVLLLSGCSVDYARHAWVDPATATDIAKYNADTDECRAIAKQAFYDKRAAERGPLLASVGGAVLGAVLGGGIAGSVGLGTTYGAVLGGVTGAGTQQGSLEGQLEVLRQTMRSCLRDRGYEPLQ